MDIYPLKDTGVILKFSGGTLVLNPPEKMKKSPLPGIVLTTYPVPVTVAEGQKLFSGAGEYEKDGVHIRGYGTETVLEKNPIQTTSWLVESDGIRIFIPGTVRERKDLQQVLSDVMRADVLLHLCTDGTRLNAADAGHIAATLQAQWVVPVGDDEQLKERIAKDIGTREKVEKKFTVKKKDITEGAGAVAVQIV